MMVTSDGIYNVKDEGSISMLSSKQKVLKGLIIQNSDSLKELSFNGSFLEGSIGDIISVKLGGSCSLSGWDYDFDVDGDDDGDDDESGDLGGFFSSSDMPELEESEASETSLLELSPGNEKPIRSAMDTWKAIRDGNTTIVSCKCCGTELHSIADAELVVCPDCWAVSPIEQSVGGIVLECDDSTASQGNGVGLGVKAHDVLQWLEK